MIAPLLAALTLQAAPPDAATVILGLRERCLAAMTETGAPGTGSSTVAVAGGLQASVSVRRDGCSLTIDGWRDRSEDFIHQVYEGVMVDDYDWQMSAWRRPQAGGTGSTLRTSFILPDAHGRRTYEVQILEPAEGAPARLSVTFRFVP